MISVFKVKHFVHFAGGKSDLKKKIHFQPWQSKVGKLNGNIARENADLKWEKIYFNLCIIKSWLTKGNNANPVVEKSSFQMWTPSLLN